MTVINGLPTPVPSVDYAIPVTGRSKKRRCINCDWLQQHHQQQQQQPLCIVGEKAWEEPYHLFD
ncbi:MAG TPA: hypothetical protein VJ695_00175 [Nitrososphaera sp.]|nr:hypothetical protein [Nitrososphaera sp.]